MSFNVAQDLCCYKCFSPLSLIFHITLKKAKTKEEQSQQRTREDKKKKEHRKS